MSVQRHYLLHRIARETGARLSDVYEKYADMTAIQILRRHMFRVMS